MKKFTQQLMLLGCLLFGWVQLQAQATLSVQGTMQNFNGTTVDNGGYDILFKLYTAETGGTAVWSETQTVQVVNGVYSVLLGAVNPLNAAFDVPYFLGTTLPGGPELAPRSPLTSSPYSLSVIGQGNSFPSSGTVSVGNSTVSEGKLRVEGSTGAEIEFKKGANTASITYDGTNINVENLNLVFSAGLSLPAGQTIKYNGVSDWRLVDFDDFESTIEGWKSYNGLDGIEDVAPVRLAFTGAVHTGYGLGLADGYSSYGVVKKLIDLTGVPHSQVKVRVTITPSGSPDDEYIFSGFAPTLSSTAYEYGWYQSFPPHNNSNQGYVRSYTARGGSSGRVVEMTASNNLNSFVFFVGGHFSEAVTSESFVIDDVEVWVR